MYSSSVIEGGRWMREAHGYLSLPLMARPNSIVAVGANERRPDYDYANGVVFHVFELQDGVTALAHVPTTNGDRAMTLRVRRAGQQLHIQAEGAPASWSVLLRGIGSAQSVDGGTARADTLGTLLIPARGTTHMEVCL
jgi:alpha-D-xyloside xylohydrolase